jgi:PiT family inorganic phosphate transporter
MSTTHVSTGAIAGVTGRHVRRLDTATLRDFVMTWTVTPTVAGLVALTVFEATRVLIR